MRRMVAVVVLLLADATVRADAGPGLPLTKTVPAVYLIEGASEFPDHVFLIFRHGIRIDPQGREEYNETGLVSGAGATPGHPILIRPEPHEEIVLVIVPEAQYKAHPTAQELFSAVSQNKIPGATLHRCQDRATVPAWADDEVTITYRLKRSKSGDPVELVRTSRNPLWQWNAAAISLAAAIVLFGLYLVRRMLRPRSVEIVK